MISIFRGGSGGGGGAAVSGYVSVTNNNPISVAASSSLYVSFDSNASMYTGKDVFIVNSENLGINAFGSTPGQNFYNSVLEFPSDQQWILSGSFYAIGGTPTSKGPTMELGVEYLSGSSGYNWVTGLYPGASAGWGGYADDIRAMSTVVGLSTIAGQRPATAERALAYSLFRNQDATATYEVYISFSAIRVN